MLMSYSSVGYVRSVLIRATGAVLAHEVDPQGRPGRVEDAHRFRAAPEGVPLLPGGHQRRARHTLTDSEEKILADAGPLSGTPSTVYNIRSNADFPYPDVTLSDGRSVTLDQAAFGELRALPNRADREKVKAEPLDLTTTR